MMWVLRFLMLSLAGGLMVLNLQPFLEIADKLMGSVTDIPFYTLIVGLPLIGPLFQLIGRIAPDLFGVGLWLTIQVIEILPAWMRGDLSLMEGLIRGMNSHARQAITGSDSQPVADLKKEYNNAPHIWLKRANTLAVAAYVVEATLCFLRFPPYKGGLAVFWEDVQMGISTIDNIDWGNLGNALATMFGFELLLVFVIWALLGVRYFMRPESQTTYYEAPAAESGSSQSRRVTR